MYEDREVFRNAPLDFVAKELIFPFAPTLGKEETIKTLRTALGSNFPITRKDIRPSGISISPLGARGTTSRLFGDS